jgi:uncharacterized protein YbbC (DUF1343 family)
LVGQAPTNLQTGADQIPLVVSKLTGKKVALMVNHTSLVGKKHLIDTLLSAGIDIKKIFAVEHGYRGTADAGEILNDSVDKKTGLPVISLYGENKSPLKGHLEDIDIVVFDIQSVGVRFYTYLGSLDYLMRACTKYKKKVLVLDRPNPNGAFVDGPVLRMDAGLESFVSMQPVPIVHGLTAGEYANMLNGEGWLDRHGWNLGGEKCDLEIVPVKNWQHSDPYSPPVKPSPNLPNDQSIALYPSTCLFEGTILSEGRGTFHPFEWIGHPDLKQYSFSFTPVSIDGMSKEPKLKGQVCYGLDLRLVKAKKSVDLSYLIELYQAFPDKSKFFTSYFDKLAGTPELKEQIMKGMTEEQIKATWQKDLEAFKTIRKKYVLYP